MSWFLRVTLDTPWCTVIYFEKRKSKLQQQARAWRPCLFATNPEGWVLASSFDWKSPLLSSVIPRWHCKTPELRSTPTSPLSSYCFVSSVSDVVFEPSDMLSLEPVEPFTLSHVQQLWLTVQNVVPARRASSAEQRGQHQSTWSSGHICQLSVCKQYHVMMLWCQ